MRNEQLGMISVPWQEYTTLYAPAAVSYTHLDVYKRQAEAFGIKVIPTYNPDGTTADILFNL